VDKYLPALIVRLSIVGALCAVLLMVPIASQGQAEDKITPDEANRSLILAHRFAEDLVRYKDLVPLIPKYFLQGFERKLPDAATPILVDGIRRTPHLRKELKRFYIAQNNFLLLTVLYQISRIDTTKVDSDDETVHLPADVWRVIKPQKDLWDKLTADGKFGQLTVAESNKYFDKSVRLLEAVNSRLRRHVAKVTPKSPAVQESLKSQQMNGYKTFDTWEYTCDKQCYLDFSFPKGTRLVIVEMPFLQQLVLVSRHGKLRIVAAILSD
jgi:hypothetical protein